MAKHTKVERPPLAGAIIVTSASVFNEENVRPLLESVSKPPQQTAAWVAEALNQATTTFYSAFAFSEIAPPSEKAAWALKLSAAADICLQMLAPDSVDGGRPRAHFPLPFF